MNEPHTPTSAARYRGLVSLALALASLGLYLGTLSRGAFPGLPAKSLVAHLGLDSAPTLLDSIWGLLVQACARLPGGDAAF